jgi:hypothetical protein
MNIQETVMEKAIHGPCETPNECNKFIEISGSRPTNESTCHHNEKSKDVLLPFDTRIRLAALGE